MILPVGHPDNPFPTSRSAVGLPLRNGTGGSDNLQRDRTACVTGLKGTLGNFDWETAALYNRSERTEHYFGMLYKPTLNRIMTENRTLAATLADPTVDPRRRPTTASPRSPRSTPRHRPRSASWPAATSAWRSAAKSAKKKSA